MYFIDSKQLYLDWDWYLIILFVSLQVLLLLNLSTTNLCAELVQSHHFSSRHTALFLSPEQTALFPEILSVGAPMHASA